jgi:type I restriction enzyme S subunit
MSSELRELWINAGGRVPQDWNIVSLETLFQDAKGIAVGVMYPGTHAVGGIPLIKVGDIKGGCIPVQPDFCISVETNHEYRRSQLVGNELLITLVGNPGECVVVTPQMAGWNPARAIAVIKLKDTGLRTYVKTVLESAAGKHLIDSVLNTTVQKTLNLKDIRRLPIPMPAGSTIKNISTLSEAFSDRIALLRETNQTLEAVAQALFKSWFVDFDPVRAKAEGRLPEGIDEATAALFPDAFEESELGLVPRGWEVEPLDKVASFLNGLALQKFPPTGQDDLPVIKIAQLRKGDTIGADLAAGSIKSEYIIKNGDVLFSWSGSLEVDIWCGGDGALNQHLFKVTSSRFERWFYYLWTKHHLAGFRQIAASKATTMGHIQRSHLTLAKVVVPSSPILAIANELFEPLVDRIVENTLQANTLSNLRDTLLPRLISGQLRIADAEEELEKAMA